MGWGGPGGGHFGGGGGGGAGLPFAGIPPELAELADKILKNEPEHPEPRVEFSHVTPETRPFSLGRFLRPQWQALGAGVLLVALETITMQAGPLLTQRAIDKGLLSQPPNFGIVLAMSLLYLGSIGVSSVATFVRISWTGRLGQRLMRDLRVRVFSHLQRLSMSFYSEEKAGRVMTRMTSDIEALTELLQDGLVNLLVQGFTLVFVVAVLFSLNATLAAIVVFAIVPVMTLMTLWFRSASERTYGNVRERIADVMADLQENLAGVRIIAAYNRQRFNAVKHRNIVGDHMAANNEVAKIGAIYGPGTDMIGGLGSALILIVGGRMVASGSLQVGELVAFVLYLGSFFAPIQQLVQLYNQYQSGQAAVAKLRDLLATAPEVEESPAARELPPIDGEIRFDDVSFGYYEGVEVLSSIDLTIHAGETFALVGPTGSGKSTIAKLVTRFYDPTAGSIRVDGHDLRDVKLETLRRQLGVVPQEAFLFGGSIRDNVGFARPGATDAEILEACQAVGLQRLLDRLPEGIHTPVFERGSSLSSGERQLLALARAFLAQPRVLILDEATSSLDLRSEATIEDALDVVLQGRTS
ncbi:MAG TPA: ABC transporter ATP-binding protein, partial [Acidimicrobiales bacterium]|nr:ABC transporter ATP-binding protein [Acidimicrobiales bacterium]